MRGEFMFKSNLFNFKLFYKYLLSYIIILLIPLLVLNFISYNYYVRSLREEIKKNNINKWLFDKCCEI